jgi:flavin-dependent dehydrogenase
MDSLDPIRPRYDAVVIGARAAGAAAALLLARKGLSVLAVDRGTYGSDTLSTHALLRAGVLQLARWGLLGRVVDEGTPPVKRTVFHYDDEVVDIPIKAHDGVPALFAPRRTVLDRLLVDAAVEAGAQVRHQVKLVDLLRDAGGRVEGASLQGVGGSIRPVRADLVVGADGARSTVGSLVHASVTRQGRNASAVVYGYWSGLDVEGYHWYWGSGAAAGAIPTNGGQTLLFAGLPAKDYQKRMRGNLSAEYLRILTDVAPDLAERLQRAQLSGPLRVFPGLAGYLRRPWGPGWALVGDAAYYKDPITAHGISDALRDAELLADAVVQGGERAMAAYESRRDDLSIPLFDVTDRIASLSWSSAELKSLHLALSDEMKREVAAMVGPNGVRVGLALAS